MYVWIWGQMYMCDDLSFYSNAECMIYIWKLYKCSYPWWAILSTTEGRKGVKDRDEQSINVNYNHISL